MMMSDSYKGPLDRLINQLSANKDLSVMEGQITDISFLSETRSELFDCLYEFFRIKLASHKISFSASYLSDLHSRIHVSPIDHAVKAEFYKKIASLFVDYLGEGIADGRLIAAECIHRSFFYLPLQQNDDRITMMNDIEKNFYSSSIDKKTLNQEAFDNFKHQWFSFFEKLKQDRMDVLAAFEHPLSTPDLIHQARVRFNLQMQELVKKVIGKTVEKIKVYSSVRPPCSFVLMGTGSVGLHYLTAYSDIDLAILIPEAGVATQRNRKSVFFELLVKLLQFQFICLGESWDQNMKGKKQGGTTVDRGDFPYLFGDDPAMLNTPEQMALRWFPCQQEGVPPESNSLLHPALLYASTPEAEGLYQQYLDKIHALWREQACHESLGYYLFMPHVFGYAKRMDAVSIALEGGFSDHFSLNFKDDILRPLLLWVSDVAILLGGYDHVTIDEMMRYLGNRKDIFHVNFSQHLMQALAEVWRLKFILECHHIFSSQYDVMWRELLLDHRSAILSLLSMTIIPLVNDRESMLRQFARFSPVRKRLMDSIAMLKDEQQILSGKNTYFLLKTASLSTSPICAWKESDEEQCEYFSVPPSVSARWVRKIAYDIDEFDFQALSSPGFTLLPVSTSEGERACRLNALPTPGYHPDMVVLWSYFFNSPIAYSERVILSVFTTDIPCLLILKPDLAPDVYYQRLTPPVFTALLLRALLVDVEASKQCCLLYCLDEMSELLDAAILNYFLVWSPNWLECLWVHGLERQAIIDGTAQQLVLPEVLARYMRLQTVLKQRNQWSGFDVFMHFRPDCAGYARASLLERFDGDRHSIVQQRCQFVERQLRRVRDLSPRRLLSLAKHGRKKRPEHFAESVYLVQALDWLNAGTISEQNLSVMPAYRQSSLHIVAKHGTPEQLMCFIGQLNTDQQSWVTSQNYAGWSILHYVVNNAQRLWCSIHLRQLIEQMGDRMVPMISACNRDGWTPFHYLIRNKHGVWQEEDILLFLGCLGELAKPSLLKQNAMGWTVLHYLLRNKGGICSESVLTAFIQCLGEQASKTILEAAPSQWTCVHLAARYSSFAAFKVLLLAITQEEALEVCEQKTREGFTPARLAWQNSDHRDIYPLLCSRESIYALYNDCARINVTDSMVSRFT